MSLSKRIISLVVPLFLIGCQVAPGRWGAKEPALLGESSRIATAAGMTAGTQATQLPPTVDTTLTSQAGKGAVISLEPAAAQQRPPQFGGLAISVRWPDRPARSAQMIPLNANSLWVKVFSGKTWGSASGSLPPATNSILASRVVPRGMNDPVPGSSPSPGPSAGQPWTTSTVYLSLPPGDVTVWVGTFAELATQVATDSDFLSSGQISDTIVANTLLSPRNLALGANPDVAPKIFSVAPAYAAPGSQITLTGANFPANPTVNLFKAGCSNCNNDVRFGPLTILSAASNSIVAQLPSSGVNSDQYQAELAGNFTLRAGSVSVIDSNNKLTVNLDSTKYKDWYNNGTHHGTVVGSTVKVLNVHAYGYVPTWQDISLPLSNLAIQLTDPTGATSVLDATNGYSFVASATGDYRVTASLGSVNGSGPSDAPISAYHLNSDAAIVTSSQFQFGSNNYSVEKSTQPVVQLRNDSIKFLTEASGPYYGWYPYGNYFNNYDTNAYFVDDFGQYLPNSPTFGRSDFNWATSVAGIVSIDSKNVQITTTAAGNVVLGATLAMNPSYKLTKTITVLGPTRVDLPAVSLGVSAPAYEVPAVIYSSPAHPEYAVREGGASDFTLSVKDSGVASWDPTSGLLTGQQSGTASILTATVNAYPNLSATASVTVQ